VDFDVQYILKGREKEIEKIDEIQIARSIDEKE
jgi:hypothetical protein